MNDLREYSVSSLSKEIKDTLEGKFSRIRVRGEITELKRYPSGHIYFSLKDEGGKISGIVWRSQVTRLGLAPENGLEVVGTGRVSAYGERSSYQFIIEKFEYAGEGAMLARIEKLRQLFIQEGLFSLEHKKTLPYLPLKIGVITSSAGAVLQDIRTTLERRFPREILLWPVLVQGQEAAEQIAEAIEGMNQLSSPPDVLIVGRGGGSLEDLMAFNEEVVVRAVFNSNIPVISAVGHETDTTLIDFVSDQRAPTPTAAAEMAVPLRSEVLSDLMHQDVRLRQGLGRYLQNLHLSLENKAGRLPNMLHFFDGVRMRLEDRSQRLRDILPEYLRGLRQSVRDEGRNLRPMTQYILKMAESDLRQILSQILAAKRLIFEKKNILESKQRQLEALSPKAILERGYVLVEDKDGQIKSRSSEIKKGAMISLVFFDGQRDAQLDTEKKNLPKKTKAKKKGLPSGDGNPRLF
ncbi:exodeoxyribonuclease VII large subunit [Acetobacteraceae bacterium]|nr:exodeoxyribonuclease VII large subunit [Acetobacteraceae bacterium]